LASVFGGENERGKAKGNTKYGNNKKKREEVRSRKWHVKRGNIFSREIK
jgi:hypothetical protein